MTILYIDDDADDRELLNMAMHKADPSVQLCFAANGLAGLHFLQQAKADDALPCVVVLDINMPILDGKKTLELLRQDPVLRPLPVVVFTSSQNPNDKVFFNTLTAAFISKPTSPSALTTFAHLLLQYCQGDNIAHS